MMRPFLTTRHPVLRASRAFASRGSIRLHQTAITYYADDNTPSSSHSTPAEGNLQHEPYSAVDEPARPLQKSKVKGKTPTVEIAPVLPSLDELCLRSCPR